jgi:hypothetical protein
MIARFVAPYWVHQLQLRSSEVRKWAGAPDINDRSGRVQD